jgi:alpha-tubulin suppressor-like RCC1 family protein
MGKIRNLNSLLFVLLFVFLPYGCKAPFGPDSYIDLKNANLQWNFQSYDFGQLPVGATAKQTFEIANTGNSIAKDCGPVQLNDNINFSITQNTCSNVDMHPNEVCSIEIEAHPSAVGEKTLQILRECKDNYTILSPKNEIRMVAVLPSVQWDILAHSFGNVGVNSDSVVQVFTLSNVGETAATGCGLATISNPTDFIITNDTCGVLDLAVNQTCEISVKAHPQSTGIKTTTLNRSCSLGGSVSTTTDQIVVTATGPNLYWGANSYNFGSILVGNNSGGTNFWLYNSGGSSDATGCSVPVLSNTTDFTLVTNNCGTSDLVNGGSCYAQVRANPQSAGQKTTTLSRSCSLGGTVSTTTDDITVTGSLTTDWVERYSLTSFSNVHTGRDSSTFSYYFRNPNNQQLTGCSAPVLTNTTDFTIVSDSCGTGIMPAAGLCEVQLKANPITTGYKSTNLNRSCVESSANIGVDVTGLDNSTVVKIESGYEHSCALRSNGTISCWGYNSSGQLGIGSTSVRQFPVIVSGISNAVDISVGNDITCALLSDKTVKCWGPNGHGTVGDGTTTARTAPVQVLNINTASKIYVGSITACALLDDGTLMCWGYNGAGRMLGDGTSTSRSTPVVVANGITNILDISIGTYHICAVVQDGADEKVKCWGENGYGQLGNGNTTLSYTPVDVLGINNAVKVSVYNYSGCALLSDGTVKCWGYNNSGELGNGTTVNSSSPVLVSGITNAIHILVDAGSACAILSDYSVKCWGANIHGRFLDGTSGVSTTPKILNGMQTQNLSMGSYHTCALLADNKVKCWGYNFRNEIADGSLLTEKIPVEVPGISNAIQSTAMVRSSCALLSDGTVKCWGENSNGELGNGTANVSSSVPQSVIGLSDAVQITSQTSVVHVLRSNGTVSGWGYNGAGIIGDGTTTNRNTPVAVTGLADVVTKITSSDGLTCALLQNKTVQCWGYSFYGQLGNGTTVTSSVPVLVTGLTNAEDIARGSTGYHMCAIITGGTIKCWGHNSRGQLGNGVTTNASTPVDVSGVTNAIKVSVGNEYTCAVISDGTIKCWGYNSYGQLGNSTSTNSMTPVSVTGISNAVDVVSGGDHACAILSDAKVKCWGRNSFGQLGDGTTSSRTSPVYRLGPSSVVHLSNNMDNVNYGHRCLVASSGGVSCSGSNSNNQLGFNYYTPKVVNGL